MTNRRPSPAKTRTNADDTLIPINLQLINCFLFACSFALADSLNSQLESIRLQIQKMIGKLNKGDSAQASDEPEDPVAQIAQVLDEQMASLQWVEGQSGLRWLS